MNISGLNINSSTIKIQATPILHDVIKKMNIKFDFRVQLDNVKSYGTWSPCHMAVGMPVIAIGDNSNKYHISNLDIWKECLRKNS